MNVTEANACLGLDELRHFRVALQLQMQTCSNQSTDRSCACSKSGPQDRAGSRADRRATDLHDSTCGAWRRSAEGASNLEQKCTRIVYLAAASVSWRSCAAGPDTPSTRCPAADPPVRVREVSIGQLWQACVEQTGQSSGSGMQSDTRQATQTMHNS
jgi:hypothetical protein